MQFISENNEFIIKLDLVATMALTLLLVIFGSFIKKKIPILEKLCIPSPVITGLLFSLVTLVLYITKIATIQLDLTLQTPLMITFFATVGIGGSLKILKTGGKDLFFYWILAALLSISQNVIGVTVSKILNMNPIYGVLGGAVSMAGGHGAAAAFGQTAQETMGISGSLSVALAAATFGLISGGIIGGPIAKHLINKYNLQPNLDEVENSELVQEEEITEEITPNSIIHEGSILGVIMVVGAIIATWFSSLFSDLVLPGYVGAMFVAVIFRNVNDKVKITKVNMKVMDFIGDLALTVFLTQALMSLKLWELKDLAGPLLVVLIAQVVFIALYTVFIVFRVLGKDYDAAVMVSGMIGHGLGAMPNGIANMTSVTKRFGPSTKAFMIVPLIGAFLVDIIHIPNIIFFMNLFK
ncbi:sodium/glutamate symporter [Mycoplasma sp. P36-A1]|uniref:sodium/glutamate symporter n=1 Tax=Mycoplasma sp. P36-A1 TaxID=3252900 RepID=UPI003C30A8F2